jgi:bifunctional UDP-N-acetylglucosamine pyrophosphorylase/glucosamine-1-phosphate N-acetyltransferase
LTDLVGLATSQGNEVQALSLEDAAECVGVNTRVHLAEVEMVMRRRINEAWMLAGVTMIDPHTTYISPDVQLGVDALILPNTIITGRTHIGRECEVGPNTVIEESRVGDRCTIIASMIEHSVIEDDVHVGPYTHLRKGTHLSHGVHVGNFGEIKQSYLGPDTKMGHFSYVGDAVIGANVNIGCGTVTCNFDGVNKNRTEVGDDVFLGSDTMLVAPVKMGAGSKTGAGTVVTKDIPADSLAVGVPAHIVRNQSSQDNK